MATVIEPMYDAFIDKLIKVNFRSYTKEITLILDYDYDSDNEKFNELKSKTLKKIHQSGNLHISHQSPHNVVNHLNWRIRALQKVNEDGIHYTATFSISKKEIPILKSQLLEFINMI